MKSLIIALALVCIAGMLFAEESIDPIARYFDNPDFTTFQKAVESSSDSILVSKSPNMHKLRLAYIAENEVTRLLDDLQASKAGLSTGELFNLANLYLSRAAYQPAIALYDSLNAAYPNWSCPWRHKGEAYYRLKAFTEAATALKQAIATNENHYDAYIWMAMTQKELGQYAAALKNLEKAMELSPEAEESEDKALSQEQITNLYKELQILTQ